MQLYLLSQVQELAKIKWGSAEPYIVSLAEFSEEHLAWLLADVERLKQYTPEKFQYFIADRLEHAGYSVQLVGNVYRKDGGIDIIAHSNGSAFPTLMAVQVKHHRTSGPTRIAHVRDFYGAIASTESYLRVGMIVTNTYFTPDANWFGQNHKSILRLRELHDLRRWLKNDFINEYEWREIPDEIELAPGIRIKIPKGRILLPSK